MIFNYYSPQNPVRSVDNGNITNPVLIQRSNLTLHNIWNGSEYTTVSYKNLLNTERCSFYEVTDSNIAYNGEAPYEIAGYSYVERVLPTESGFDNGWKSLINYECCRDTNIFNIYNPIVDENGNVREAIDRDLYAVYKLKSFDVAWVVGGETIGTEKVDYGSCPTIAISDPNPTDAGLNSDEYKFMGWEASDDGTVTIDCSIYPIKQNINFTAYFSNITVSFVTNNDQTLDKVWISKTNNRFTPPTISRDGYTFEGWYTDSSFSTQFTDDTAVTESITLYAKWIQIPHTLTIKEFSSGNTLGTKSTTENTVSLDESLLSEVGAAYPTVTVVANRYLGNNVIANISTPYSLDTTYDAFYSSQSDSSPSTTVTLDTDKTVYVRFKYNLYNFVEGLPQNSCAGFSRQGWSSQNDYWNALNNVDDVYDSVNATIYIYEFWKACIVFTCYKIYSLNPSADWSENIDSSNSKYFTLNQYSEASYNSFTITAPVLNSAVCFPTVRIGSTVYYNPKNSSTNLSFNKFIYDNKYINQSVTINVSDHINEAIADGFVRAYASWKVNTYNIYDFVYDPNTSADSTKQCYGYKNIVESKSGTEIESYSEIAGYPIVCYSSADGEFKFDTIMVPRYTVIFDRNVNDNWSYTQKNKYYVGNYIGTNEDGIDTYNDYETMTFGSVSAAYSAYDTNNYPICNGTEKKATLLDGTYYILSSSFLGWYYDSSCTMKFDWNRETGNATFPRLWKVKDSNGNWTEVECEAGKTYTLYAKWSFM